MMRKLFFIILLAASWEATARLGLISNLPAISAILMTLGQSLADPAFVTDVGVSMGRMIFGFTITVVVGILGGLVLGRIPAIHGLAITFILAMQSMPGIVWVPLATLIFGMTHAAIVFTIILGGTGIVLVNTDSGFRNVPPIYVNAARVMGARGLKLFWSVMVPAAIPKILDGVRLAWAFGWRALMAGELIVSIGGIGKRIGDVVHSRNIHELFVLIMVIGMIGFLVDQVVFKSIERNVQKKWGLA